jgi:DNA polymerase-3 subunit epsilon
VFLIFDTETTGKANFRLPATHPSQPRIVQLAGVLLDHNLTECASFSFIVKPDGWAIPDEAAAIHGITTAIAAELGISIEVALSVFRQFHDLASVRVAHNIDFDDLVLTADIHRATQAVCTLTGAARFCTMQAMTPLCKLPSVSPYARPGEYKWPKLTEAYRHCFGKEMEGAHDALADVRGCAAIYRWLKQNEETQRNEQNPNRPQIERA